MDVTGAVVNPDIGTIREQRFQYGTLRSRVDRDGTGRLSYENDLSTLRVFRPTTKRGIDEYASDRQRNCCDRPRDAEDAKADYDEKSSRTKHPPPQSTFVTQHFPGDRSSLRDL
jgi:hypothetical protein